ncbi:hypothetical protein FC093_19340 [Ilyomonas limi]|uniref:Addiction module protein n=1 Tax=Ilyomonas limi TaxID=2575867 RepID=A0A4U3KTL0_9BACT|nr:hypothetical protein [Ilyomonas limi]TKK65691.1 hypothetical protein FC093_19340 [Ilyomonas limi]
MTIEIIRERLHNYLKVADDKKIAAIYTLLEDDILEQIAWWGDNAFVEELNKEYTGWESGDTKGYTIEETEQIITELKSKRQSS